MVGKSKTRSEARRHGRRPRRAGGFTLIEAALTTVIIGTGVLSILAAQQAYHRKNDWAQRVGTAMLLANELRELTLTLPMHDPITGAANMGPENGENSITDYDDLDDFAGPVTGGYGAGIVFDPPVNALRQSITNMNGWSQLITVANVLPDNISSSFTQPLGTTNLMRVTVTVRYQAPGKPAPEVMTTLAWVVGE
ncbi:MAG: hypothetical protein K8S99_13645 [Planctomycetes bacterium]|nr:hypothetical protein [Planctomycetota bacterium]